MNELQKTLAMLEQTLSQLQVSGRVAIVLGDAFRLIDHAKSLAEPKKEENTDG